MFKRDYLNYLFLLIAGAVSVLAFAPFNRGLFIIISLFALLWFSASCLGDNKSRRLLIGGFTFAAGFFLAQLYWIFYSLYFIIHTGIVVAVLSQIAFSGVMTIFTMLSLWLFKKTATRSLAFNYLFLFPSWWVLGEWLRGWIFTGFPWCDIGYTQVSNYLLTGFYPLIGNYGVSWLMLSIIGFLFIVVYNRQQLLGTTPRIGRSQRLAIVYFMLLAVSGYYLHDRQYTENYGRPTKVALVQGNISQSDKWDEYSFINNLNVYIGLIGSSKADLIILPETAIATLISELPPHYLDDLSNLAKANHAQLVIGMPRVINSRGDYVNSATVVSESGMPYYAKSHLVPFGEYIPLRRWFGNLYQLFNLPLVGFSADNEHQQPLVLANQKIAFNICYENGFASELIASASQATLMANISDMVWYGNSIAKDQHLQISQARALENQRYFIQDTNTGSTAIINPAGQIQSRLPDFTRQVLTDYVQGRIGVTPYQKYGNYPLIILLLLCVIVAGFGNWFSSRYRD